MAEAIKSGRNGNTADVDDRNRLITFATTEDESVDFALLGSTFFISSGILELTSSNLSYLIYVKNNDIVDWVVREFITDIGPSTGAPGLALTTQFALAPTGGTLLSGTELLAANMNIGSPSQLAATINQGGEGFTATGGGLAPPALIVSDQVRSPFSAGPIIIPPGTAFAFGVTPAAGNTSMFVQFSTVLYRKLGVE